VSERANEWKRDRERERERERESERERERESASERERERDQNVNKASPGLKARVQHAIQNQSGKQSWSCTREGERVRVEPHALPRSLASGTYVLCFPVILTLR